MSSIATGQANQTGINSAQQETVLSAIVVSSSSHWAGQLISREERQRAFCALQDFSTQFAGRVSLCLQWLQQSQLTVANGTIDCTISAKLYACEILFSCLKDKVKNYAKWQEGDRLQLRQAIMVASRQQAGAPLVNPRDGSSGSPSTSSTSLPLANKLASLLAALMVRDFPQRWTTCIQDLFQQLWSESAPIVGNRMCLQVLQLVAEDCTDSDFNAKVRAHFAHLKQSLTAILWYSIEVDYLSKQNPSFHSPIS
mmetsp:Transcript_1135/g.2559  ORF Transcript_1135/g.2559 Transcript_1135/m.2559 type:complete len:254 (-) Transcript_1135:2634-3395(-)